MRRTNVLLVDKDSARLRVLERGISDARWSVETADTLDRAMVRVRQCPPDMIVMGMESPGQGGLDGLRGMLNCAPQLPVIALGIADPVTEAETLEAGADDYIADATLKVGVVRARIRALMRRAKPEKASATLRFEDLRLDAEAHIVRRGPREIVLSQVEFDLLRTFMENPGRVLSKRRLGDHVWEFGVASYNVVEVNVARLRKKLEASGEARVIQTIYGVGYVLRASGGAPEG